MSVRELVKKHGDHWLIYADKHIKRNYPFEMYTHDFEDYVLMKYWLEGYFQAQKGNGFHFIGDY